MALVPGSCVATAQLAQWRSFSKTQRGLACAREKVIRNLIPCLIPSRARPGQPRCQCDSDRRPCAGLVCRTNVATKKPRLHPVRMAGVAAAVTRRDKDTGDIDIAGTEL